jgi:hypothetical protein
VQASDVKPGQQFYRVGGSSSVWEVRGIYGDRSGIRHAQMFNVDRPRELKTLTCSVLCDPSRYGLLSEEPVSRPSSDPPRRS